MVADFNDDTVPDIAFTGLLENSPNYLFHVSILPGKGDGTFLDPVTTKVDDLPNSLTAGDFDADGKDDIIVAHCCGAVDLTRLRGNGDATFRPESVPGGADPVDIAAADFDGDGHLDAAVLDEATGRLNGLVWILPSRSDLLLNTTAASNTVGLLAPDSIIAVYGEGLADSTRVAATPDWPEVLAGTRVTVRDETGQDRSARIYYASPTQVNYHLPPGTAPGFALVTVTSGSGKMTQGLIRVESVAPGFFVVNARPNPAALLVRVLADGTQEIEQTVFLGTNGEIFPNTLNLGPDAEQEILVLYGTGIRNRNSLADLKVTIGGVEAAVKYAGPQSEYPGLDQVNVVIPKSLRGRGQVKLILTIGDAVSNTVYIRVN